MYITIYGDSHHCCTKQIWDGIASFVYDNQDKPILCMGGLNDILCDEDKSSPIVNIYRMRVFRALVKTCGFMDLGYNGPAYTWRNRRYTSNPTLERLDRCLVNEEWCGIYPSSNVFNLPIIFSDHAPIILSTETQCQNPRRSFKFESWWLMEKDFHAHNIWIGSSNKSFHNRTTNLACALRTWCKMKKPIQQELDNLGEQIKNVQMQPAQVQNHSLEASFVCIYEQNMTRLAEFLQTESQKTLGYKWR